MKIFITIFAILLMTSGVVFADDMDDVPDYILEDIKDRAAQKYPDSYSMQQFKIKQEAKAYLAIQNYSNDSIPYDILDSIIEKAAEKYPDSYSMQKFKIDMEVKAYIKINS